MSSRPEPLTFTVPLALSAHRQAQQRLRHHPPGPKAQQVYLKSLAIYAVNYYLRCLGWETDCSLGERQDAILSTLMDTADVVVVGCGRLECCPLLPGETALHIPPEDWSERLGFVAVQLDEPLRQATLIGFLEQVQQTPVPLEQLRSLDDLGDYLESQKQPQAPAPPIALSQWWENLVRSGWQEWQELLTPAQAGISFRWTNNTTLEPQNHELPLVSRGKILNFSGAEAVLLMVGFIPRHQTEREIWVKITRPDEGEVLPPDLKLLILDASRHTIMQTDTQENSSILVKFTGDKGEIFTIKVLLAGESQTLTFII